LRYIEGGARIQAQERCAQRLGGILTPAAEADFAEAGKDEPGHSKIEKTKAARYSWPGGCSFFKY
jgi:hypothetical protein